MNLEISAIVCTHNRASYLRKALQSLDRQSLPKSRYEVIVVDNRSADDTRELVMKRTEEMENLRYVFEPRLGLSAARNRGLSEARGTYVAYLDDDAVAAPDWLEWAVRVRREQGGSLGFLGGRVWPIWESERPDWLSDALLPFLSMTDLGDEPLEVEGASGLVGANMVFDAQTLRAAGGFPEGLGRKGTQLLSNEELQLKKRLQQMGLRSLYHPKVAVSHHVIASRLTKRWFRRRLYWQGRSDAIWWRIDTSASAARRTSRVARASASVVKSVLLWIVSVVTKRDKDRRFSNARRIFLTWGYLVGLTLS